MEVLFNIFFSLGTYETKLHYRKVLFIRMKGAHCSYCTTFQNPLLRFIHIGFIFQL